MYIFANWKAYLDFDESNILLSQLLQDEEFISGNNDIVLFPSLLSFCEIEKGLQDIPVTLGAQHVAWTPKGAYTGSVSAFHVKEAGGAYALVGHSERRHIFGETLEDTKERFFACIDAGLIPVLCVGETKAELDAGKREQVLTEQIGSILSDDRISATNNFMIAYEPVWAISGSGSGQACDPAEEEKTLYWIKQYVHGLLKKRVEVLYGGSVHAENVVSYTSLPSIDGFLIGSAASKYDTFHALLENISV